MKVVRLKYSHSEPLFYKSSLKTVEASNLESARLILSGDVCCGFTPVTLAAEYGLPVVARVAIYSDGPIISSRLFKGRGVGYAAVEDTTVSARALKVTLGVELATVKSLEGAFEKFAGVLVIGDLALKLVDRGTPYVADVGEVWRDKFGTPLVYAVFATSPRADRREVIQAVEAIENSVSYFYENPTPLVESVATKLSISRNLTEQYFRVVKYFCTQRVIRGLELQTKIMNLKDISLL